MPGHDFDKVLQEKAQQLRLEPSPEIWGKVEKQLQERRKRRIAAWIFSTAALLSGLVIFSAIILMKQRPSMLSGQDIHKEQIISKTAVTGDIAGPSGLPADHINQQNIEDKSTMNPNLTIAKKAPNIVENKMRPHLSNKTAKAIGIIEIADIEPGVSLVNLNLPALNQPVIAGPKKSSGSLTPAFTKKPDTKSNPQLKWQGVIHALVGISPLYQSTIQENQVATNEFLNLLNNQATAAALSVPEPSVKPGPAYQLGIQVNRFVGKKISVGAGLQYAYFSNQIQVGEPASAAIPIYNSSQDRVSASSIFTASGNSVTAYNNQYHLIQAPVEVSFAMGSKDRWNWLGGVSFGYLVSTNALQYNSNAGVYYSDNSVFCKWQSGVFSSITYKVYRTPKIAIAAGPFAQYQLNNLDKTNSDKHLMLFGFATRLLLNK
ncbi:hypothetical protein [Flavihumibacter profundi]|uniref:hypothetical protein n=1 Tax=Flavihumibacter profundi TaxID=2716883 RepID=UPI001CC5C30F|nr:hypothetical protein [Flavihumibacter profundi]MBZ5856490.1 hypothetical protein [Flavihumibacter profundi]